MAESTDSLCGSISLQAQLQLLASGTCAHEVKWKVRTNTTELVCLGAVYPNNSLVVIKHESPCLHGPLMLLTEPP